MPMPLHHAVLLIDHQHAEVLQFDAEHLQAQKLHYHGRHARQHGNEVRTEHEFFGQVCEALKGIGEVLVAGGHLAQTDFRHYVEKHHPQAAKQITGWETVDHPSEGQLLALAKKHFNRVDKMAGTAPLK
jgi:stalled ribosome rescue protein Dom34